MRRPISLLTLSLSVVAGACADSTAPRGENVSISLATNTAAAAAPAASAVIERVPITGNGHTLSLTSMALTVADLRLEHRGHQGADDGTVGSDDVLFAGGPLTIPLPVDGGVVTLSSRALPAGTFSEVEAELESLHLAGSYDGTAFDVAVELSHSLELTLDPPLTTTGSADQNVTVSIDFSACFRDAAGSPVDPRTLTDGGSGARRAFRDCVANRTRAFEDRDRDGHEGADDHQSSEAGDDHGSDG
ncbi:MAG TPA: hypothetical protein VHM30_10525 [Gemmatimonadaceae bacterium]|nr:hypothetical protein [Gemmatimonadaceae bacterium]